VGGGLSRTMIDSNKAIEPDLFQVQEPDLFQVQIVREFPFTEIRTHASGWMM